MLDEIKKTKLEKLQKLSKLGHNPFPEKAKKTLSNSEIVNEFDMLQGKEIFVVGRVKSLRPMGGTAFCHIEDESGKIQIFLNKEELGEKDYSLFSEVVEIGDFIELNGELFLTKTGEKTVRAKGWKMLSKSLSPVPTEYFGFKNTEELLRRRYLDLMMNPETRELFRKKNVFWQTIRNFMTSAGFLEVQTPVLENIPGGADAEPFVTHHKALNRDYYLRISLELPLKRLLVGGYEKVFEIGRVFRNEGIDREHLQEFEYTEFYAAYWDMQRGLVFAEKLFKEIVAKVVGETKTEFEGNRIEWNKKFPVIEYFDEFKKTTGLDLNDDIRLEILRAKADELGIKYENEYGQGRMIDTIYKKTVRQKIIQPCFLIGHPLEVSPLAKKDPANPKKVLRFQLIAGKVELCNAFAELNDPVDQRKRFEEQMKAREAGDKEAQMLDEDFVEALEYGMPPAFGLGMSERFFAFLMNKSVRETVIFPPMKEK